MNMGKRIKAIYIIFLLFPLLSCELSLPQTGKQTPSQDTSHIFADFLRESKENLPDTAHLIPFTQKVWGHDSIRRIVGKDVDMPVVGGFADFEKNGMEYKRTLRIVDADYPIHIYQYDFQFQEANATRPYEYDYILIGKKMFILELLAYKELPKESPPSRFWVEHAKIFSSKGRRYFSLCQTGAPNQGIFAFWGTLLFDITDKNNPTLIYQSSQAIHDKDGWGDYNSDGLPDFVHRSRDYDSLLCETLRNGRMERMKDYYLVLDKPYTHERIDLKRSKWFFPLR